MRNSEQHGGDRAVRPSEQPQENAYVGFAAGLRYPLIPNGRLAYVLDEPPPNQNSSNFLGVELDRCTRSPGTGPETHDGK